MKKNILSCLSVLLVGTFCFADNVKDYKKIILNAENHQEIFAELKNDLEEVYKESKRLYNVVDTDNFLQTEQDSKELL